MLRRLLAVAWLVVALLGLAPATSAAACGATGDGGRHSYDSSAVGRAGDGEHAAADAGLLQLGGQRDAPASPPTSAQYAGTTPALLVVVPRGAPARFIDARGTIIDRTSVRTTISAQRQGRHVVGDRLCGGKSYFWS